MPTENETLLNIETEVNNILNDLELFAKLSKVEEFMKEKYNVTITNEVEQQRGDVTYSANVTNVDEEAVEGVLVRFEKSNGTLLGDAVSDTNGNATVKLKQSNNDIYQFIANVENTPYAAMDRMYILEPENLFPLNIWSATEASNNRNGFHWGAGVNVASSSEWSTIGEHSLEFTKTAASGFTVYAESNEFIGFTSLTCTFDILTVDETVVCRLGTHNYPNIASTTVPASTEKQTVVLSVNVPPGENIGRISFLPQVDNASSYVDNIRLVGHGGSNILFYDPATTGTSADWRNWNQNGTRTPSSTGTVIESNGEGMYMLFANAYGTSANVYDYNAQFFVEFDVVSQTNSPKFQAYSTDEQTNFEVDLSQTGHYKFSYDGETMQWWIGETEQTSETITLTNARVGFKIQEGRVLKFKEFMIYKEEEE